MLDPAAHRHGVPTVSAAAIASAQLRQEMRGQSFYRRRGKRVMDVALVLATLPIILVVIGLAAVAIGLSGGRPFYGQDRLGRGGRVFRLWKLRTMVHDAEGALQRHLAADPEAQREWSVYQKLERDPRVTRVGYILRKTSLDELPQVWNVLKGDMSLVGPRPMLSEQFQLYPGRAYTELRPGLTGPWQIGERNGSAFSERARYDDAYWQDLSLGTDIRIIFATVRVVAQATGK